MFSASGAENTPCCSVPLLYLPISQISVRVCVCCAAAFWLDLSPLKSHSSPRILFIFTERLNCFVLGFFVCMLEGECCICACVGEAWLLRFCHFSGVFPFIEIFLTFSYEFLCRRSSSMLRCWRVNQPTGYGASIIQSDSLYSCPYCAVCWANANV